MNYGQIMILKFINVYKNVKKKKFKRKYRVIIVMRFGQSMVNVCKKKLKRIIKFVQKEKKLKNQLKSKIMFKKK